MEFHDKKERLKAIRHRLNDLFTEARKDGKDDLANIKSVTDPVAEIERLQKEAADLHDQIDQLQAISAAEEDLKQRYDALEATKGTEAKEKAQEKAQEKASKRPALADAQGAAESPTDALKTWSEGFLANGSPWTVDKPYQVKMGMKALFAESNTSTNYPPENRRTGEVVPSAQAPVLVQNMIRMVALTEGNAETYMEETPSGDPTASGYFQSEGAVYFEDSWDLTERTSNVRDVGAFIPATRDQLDDVAGARDILENALTGRIMRAVEYEILSGNGTAPRLDGFLNKTGTNAITQAAGDSFQSAFASAIQAIETQGQGMPSAIVVTNADWWTIVTQQTSTGAFLWGGSAAADAVALRFHGVPIYKSQFIATNRALVGDFTGPWGCRIRDRQMLSTFWERQHDSSGNQTRPTARWYIAGDVRLALTIMRPSLFSVITLS